MSSTSHVSCSSAPANAQGTPLPPDVRQQALRARRGGRGAVLAGPGVVADDERAPTVGAGSIKQRRPRGPIVDHGGTQAAVERGGYGELVAGVDVELVGEGGGAVGCAGVVAQELVDRGDLTADPRGLPARRLHGTLGVAHLAANPFGGGLRLFALGLGRGDALGLRGRPPAGLGQLLFELGQLTRELGLAVAVERGDRVLQTRDPLRGLGVLMIGSGLGGERRLDLPVSGQPGLDRGGGGPRGLGAVADPLGGAPRGVGAARELLALGAARRQCLLGGLAPLGHGLELDLKAAPALTDLGRHRLCGDHGGALAPHVVAGEIPADLQRLALEPFVQLGGLGLALERPQPRPGLAFDVEGAVEIVLGTGQLELGAPAALAVLAQPSRLLDEQAPIARLGGDQRLDPSLRDDRMHLLAQPGVRQELDDVDQATASSREAVLALAGPIEPALDGDLGDAEPEAPLAVVEDELHLGVACGLAPRGAAEDDVLHRLAADRAGGLLAERPQDGVGHVGLARAVGPDDHADARAELELGPVREGLEALDGDRLQIHAAP